MEISEKELNIYFNVSLNAYCTCACVSLMATVSKPKISEINLHLNYPIPFKSTFKKQIKLATESKQ